MYKTNITQYNKVTLHFQTTGRGIIVLYTSEKCEWEIVVGLTILIQVNLKEWELIEIFFFRTINIRMPSFRMNIHFVHRQD